MQARTRKVLSLKNRDHFKEKNTDAQDLARAIHAVNLSIEKSAAAAREIFIVNEQKNKPAHANKWAAQMAQIRQACRHWTDEDVRLYECGALTSWESR